MNRKQILLPSLVVAIAAAIASGLVANRKAPTWASSARVPPAVVIAAEPAVPAAVRELEGKLPVPSGPENIPPAAKPHNPAPPAVSPKTKAVQDPTARVALSWVGADPEAEDYWVGAINDPNLSAAERQDLIEDLNEDGLSDPEHLVAEDLPLIMRRIELIEELEPDAMDQVNAKAFAEAHKDLVNLLAGQPAD